MLQEISNQKAFVPQRIPHFFTSASSAKKAEKKVKNSNSSGSESRTQNPNPNPQTQENSTKNPKIFGFKNFKINLKKFKLQITFHFNNLIMFHEQHNFNLSSWMSYFGSREP